MPAEPAPTRITPSGVVSHDHAADGSAAPACASHRMGCAHHPAAQPGPTASAGQKLSSAAANPRTVVGPTKGAASTFASTPTTDTWPLMAVTIGWVASCAARATANASATHLGHQRTSAATSLGPSSTIPAQAAADNANPAEAANHGSIHISAHTATASPRTLLDPRATPVAASATRPMAAARSTDGSCPHTSTNPPTPTTAAPRTHHPRSPAPRTAARSTTRVNVRLAPETAIKCVRPVALKASLISSVTADVSPTTSEGTSAACSGGECATAARSPDLNPLASASSGPGASTRVGSPRRLRSAAAESPGSVAPSRTRAS